MFALQDELDRKPKVSFSDCVCAFVAFIIVGGLGLFVSFVISDEIYVPLIVAPVTFVLFILRTRTNVFNKCFSKPKSTISFESIGPATALETTDPEDGSNSSGDGLLTDAIV